MGDKNRKEYKMLYFDVRALGEPIRWIFHYVGVPFVDERIPWDYPGYALIKKNFGSTVGQIPILYVDGKELCQSSSISRYLGDEFRLLGDTAWDRARGDEIINLITDLFLSWRTNCFERDPQRRIETKSVIDAKFQTYYAKFQSILAESDGDFVNGKKLTHADFWLASFIQIWDEPLEGEGPIYRAEMGHLEQSFYYKDLTLEHPLLRKHKDTVLSIPQIKQWIQTRPKRIC